MATRSEWNRLINLTHELALVESDLRAVRTDEWDAAAVELADRILFERF